MDISELLNILKWRKWVIIVCVLVTMLVVFLATWLTPPTYTATATLRIATSSSSSTYSDYYFADRLITTYMNIATSRPLVDELISQLGLSNAPSISVGQIPNSELIQISVEDRDPALAMTAANTLGSILITRGSEFFTGSGKSPADILKEQVDHIGEELDKLRNEYYDHLARYPDDTEGNQINAEAVDMQQQLYFELLSQYQSLLSRETIQSNIVSFVESASLPAYPSKPNKAVNLALGFVVSLIGGIALAFLFDSLDSTMHTSGEISKVANPIQTIGRIPTITRKEERLLSTDGNTRLDEAISNLRTTFLSVIEESHGKSYLIVSSLQGEGKTMLSSNLALSLAQSGKKVILVDCDLRVPGIHKIFDLQNNDGGLSDYLLGNITLKKSIKRTIHDNLHVITAGPVTKKPALLLESSRMKSLIPKLSEDYEYVLLDTPAILAVSDSSVLTPLVDGVLMVTRLGVTRKEKLTVAIEQMKFVKARFIGLAINGDESANLYSYYARRMTPLQGEKNNGGKI